MTQKENNRGIIYLILLALVNILFGIAPIFVKPLEDINMSTFTMSFYRFFGASLIELVLIVIILIHFYRKLKKNDIRKSFFRVVKEVARNYYLEPNSQFFKGRKQIGYLVFVGILLTNLCVPFYFLSYQLAGLVVSTIFVNAFTLLIIAFVNWLKKEERMDMLKVMDLVLLIAAVFTIAYSTQQSHQYSFNLSNISVILIVIIAYSTFLIYVARDGSSKKQILTNVNLTVVDRTGALDREALLIRALLKLFGIQFLGGLILIPFTGILYFISPDSLLGNSAHDFLIRGLPSLFQMMLNPNVFALIVLASVIPYFLLVYTGINWPKKALKQDMWASIFALFDPLLGLYIGFLIWKENIKPDYVVFTTLFLVAGIIIRYFHEIANARKFIFVVKLKKNQKDAFLKYIEKVREIDQIEFMIGTYDFLLYVTVRSMDRLAKIADRINYFAGLERAYYSVADSYI